MCVNIDHSGGRTSRGQEPVLCLWWTFVTRARLIAPYREVLWGALWTFFPACWDLGKTESQAEKGAEAFETPIEYYQKVKMLSEGYALLGHSGFYDQKHQAMLIQKNGVY
jgi:hypothetical protein